MATNTSGDHNTTSICPKGWSIPVRNTASNSYRKLDVDMGGTGEDLQSTVEASNRWRKYPSNFLLSGFLGSSSAYARGSFGAYWSSATSGADYSGVLYLQSSLVSPKTAASQKYNGSSARCVAGQ